MKLQKLIITGFGPYASKQELNFEESLQGKNMFVITGNTGAGKTTIFDAINFALYGEASGSDRDGKSLRSDFAEGDTPTEVEIFFSLRDKEYYVKRSPSYFKPKKKGEGFTESKPTAELKIIGSKTITGSKEVTREIESILGISSDQFKQLVMIPQGEFKKLLNSKSDEKEEIFRKIFGTEIFEKIQRDIKDQAIKLRKTVEQVERDRASKIRSFICSEENEELFRIINEDKLNIDLIMKSFEEFIDKDKEEQVLLDKKIKTINTAIEKISESLTVGKEINRKFENLEKTKEELNSLTNLIKDYEYKGISLGRGRKAITVKVYEDKYNEKNAYLKKINGDILELEKKIVIYKESNLKAEEELKLQQSKEKERDQLIKNIDEISRLKEKVLDYEESLNKVNKFTGVVENLKNRIKEIELISEENTLKVNKINNELDEIHLAKDRLRKLEVEKIEYINKGSKFTSLINSINQWNMYYEKYITEKAIFEKLENQFNKEKTNTEFLEDTLRKSQAGLLALGLEDGTNCPVCGSCTHPNLAKLENSEITEELVKASKDSLEKSRALKENKLTELTDINSNLKSIKYNSIDILVGELLNKEITSNGKVSSEEYDNLKEIKDQVMNLINNNNETLSELKIEIEKLNNIIIKEKEKLAEKDNREKDNELLKSELKTRNEELILNEGNKRAITNKLETIKSEFKGDIRTLKELETIEENLNKNLKKLKADYDNAEKIFNSSKTLLDQEMGSYNNAKKVRDIADIELKEVLEVFKEKVLSLGFENYKDYKNSVLSESEIENLDKEINNFNSKLTASKKLYEASLKEVDGKSIVDLTDIQGKLDKENNNRIDLLEYSKELFSRIKNNTSVIEYCQKYNTEIEVDEKKYKTVGKLSNILNGDNTKRISFERYVLAAYFEDIIEAANIRFNKMTSNRFELLRKQSTGDMRKGQGLDLEVFDNYTGKSRDIKTLSGGESFKASLAMALGLADIVQAHAGGIQLDTIFIDEGFGTLDPESLDNAIECLIDLQNDGRLVGVISHVAELKERIDARLEISSTNKGSKAEFRI